MRLYLDTSALVPLLIEESSSSRCGRLWDAADLKFASRIAYVETAAALASARRARRIVDDAELALAHERLDLFWAEIAPVEIDATLMLEAASLAHTEALRGYAAVHCASALRVAAVDLVAASGDAALCRAWRRQGAMVADVNETT